MPKTLLFITGNANKLREVQAILFDTTEGVIELQSRDLDLPELQGSVEEVSAEKCRRAAEIVSSTLERERWDRTWAQNMERQRSGG